MAYHDPEFVAEVEAYLKSLYATYVDGFDPTPQYLYDDWLRLPEYDEWREELIDQLCTPTTQTNVNCS